MQKTMAYPNGSERKPIPDETERFQDNCIKPFGSFRITKSRVITTLLRSKHHKPLRYYYSFHFLFNERFTLRVRVYAQTVHWNVF